MASVSFHQGPRTLTTEVRSGTNWQGESYSILQLKMHEPGEFVTDELTVFCRDLQLDELRELSRQIEEHIREATKYEISGV